MSRRRAGRAGAALAGRSFPRVARRPTAAGVCVSDGLLTQSPTRTSSRHAGSKYQAADSFSTNTGVIQYAAMGHGNSGCSPPRGWRGGRCESDAVSWRGPNILRDYYEQRCNPWRGNGPPDENQLTSEHDTPKPSFTVQKICRFRYPLPG